MHLTPIQPQKEMEKKLLIEQPIDATYHLRHIYSL